MKFFSLPTWLLNQLICGKEHPFYGITLKNWHMRSTSIAAMFDCIFWSIALVWSTVVIGFVMVFS